MGLQGEKGPVGLQGERGQVRLQGKRGPVRKRTSGTAGRKRTSGTAGRKRTRETAGRERTRGEGGVHGPTCMPEELQEVVSIGGAHGLGRVALVLQVVLAGVGGVHTQATQGPRLTRIVALENQLQQKKQGFNFNHTYREGWRGQPYAP